MIGVVDLTCAAADFNPLLLPFAKRAAREIGHRLREGVNPRRLPARSWLSLTDTERAVAHLAAQGLSSRVVADRMGLSQPTVRSHLRRVFRKLGVRSQVELARVIEQGAARARTMAAVDDTRQRIERDLHDGLQQRLVTLGLQVRAAEVSVPPSRRGAEVGTRAGGRWPDGRAAATCGRSPAGSTRRSSPSEAWSPR